MWKSFSPVNYVFVITSCAQQNYWAPNILEVFSTEITQLYKKSFKYYDCSNYGYSNHISHPLKETTYIIPALIWSYKDQYPISEFESSAKPMAIKCRTSCSVSLTSVMLNIKGFLTWLRNWLRSYNVEVLVEAIVWFQ